VNDSQSATEAPGDGKNLILLLDGTWNDSEFSATDTNIVRLREKLSDAMHTMVPPAAAGGTDVQHGNAAGRKNIVLYQRGVGTGALDQLRGGAFGIGLAENIRNAYRFICANYDPKDKIFIFGFSRGAFTARSLAGYIAAAGIIKREECTVENESRAWHYYRAKPGSRMSGVAYKISKGAYAPSENMIECVGVFDTVGSLGVPFRRFSRLNRALYEFHDVVLSPISKFNLHALAIDEHRWPFGATLWRKSKFNVLRSKTEQVWFSGSHSDVGGGNVEDASRSSSYPELDDIAFEWMLQRVMSLCPDFPSVSIRNWEKADGWANQLEARNGLYHVYKTAYRSIGGHLLRRRFWETTVGIDRHNPSQSEMIHTSAIERFGQSVPVGGKMQKYAPRNLLAYMSAYADSKEEEGRTATQKKVERIPVVGWNGLPLDEKTELDLIKQALNRS
jgi:uncharacterized protein (DUF2235 family)